MQRLINLYILENTNSILIAPCQVKVDPSALLHAALYNCMVLLNADVT